MDLRKQPQSESGRDRSCQLRNTALDNLTSRK
jgi:hypothetical protein